MNTKKYHTGQKRILAAIIDGFVFIPFLFVDHFIISPITNGYFILMWQTFTAFVPILYSIIGHCKYGQTLGKWVVGIKVLDISEDKTMNFKQAILRDSVYLTIEFIGLCYFLFWIVKDEDPQYLSKTFNDFTGTTLLLWTFLELITMFTNKKKRAIHDLLAKSVVIIKE